MAGAPGTSFSTAELAKAFGLSRNHLARIVQQLARGGGVETRRGSGGGAVLRQDPAELRLRDVVRSLEDRQALVECLGPAGGDRTIAGRCRLKARLRHAEVRSLKDLNRSTFRDIALPARDAA